MFFFSVGREKALSCLYLPDPDIVLGTRHLHREGNKDDDPCVCWWLAALSGTSHHFIEALGRQNFFFLC